MKLKVREIEKFAEGRSTMSKGNLQTYNTKDFSMFSRYPVIFRLVKFSKFDFEIEGQRHRRFFSKLDGQLCQHTDVCQKMALLSETVCS